MFGIGFGEIFVIALIALFWAVVVVLIISMLRWVVSGGVRDAAKKTETAAGGTAEGTAGGTASGQTARQILDKRYAGGDIIREEYERMRRDIEAD